MPEIGYWKYVRFTDDEKQYWGTDDDIVQIFDSADDRLEFRMKKDIRFEDDTGAEILTLDKANRHVEIPVQLNVAALEEYAAGAGITVNATMNFASGSNLNLNNNLLQNVKLGSNLNVNNYRLVGVGDDTGTARIGGGSDGFAGTGGTICAYGVANVGVPGGVDYQTGKVSGGRHKFFSWNAALTGQLARLTIGDGDTADIDVTNARIDLHDQALEATAGAIAGYFRLKVGDTEYKVPAYALT